MPLLTLAEAELHYGDLPLLDRAALAVEAGERIGLIGRNGTGKSSLLSVLTGTVALDDGVLKKMDGLKIVRVEQEPVVPENSDEKLVYEITKTLFERKDDLVKVHKDAGFLDLANQMTGASPLPFHKGALKYYQEKGLKVN